MAANSAILLLLAAAMSAAGQQPNPAPPKSHQGPHSGVTVRKVPATSAAENIAATETAQAEAAMDKKDDAGAEALLKQAVGRDPKSYRAWFDLGVLYARTQRPQDAIEAYKKAVALDPKLFEANFNLGVLLARQGDLGAETYLRAATQLTPTTGKKEDAAAAAWNALGILLSSSKPKEAIVAFQRQAALQPKSSSGHILAGKLAEKTGDLATAQQEYATAQQIDPHNAEAAAGTANVLMESGQLDKAEAAVRNYLALVKGEADTRNEAQAHLELGRVLIKLHRRDEAIAEFEQAAKLSPDAVPLRELAWSYLQDKQYGKAEPLFRQLTQKNPNDADAHEGLGETLIQLMKFPEAQQELLAAVQLKPGLAEAYGDLALAASKNNDFVLALKALDARAKSGMQETPGTLFLRATSLDHLGAREQAAAAYREFLSVSNGRYPDQEWQARHRLVAIAPTKK